jgi:catechol 2,3-dioxygenase-like lactoylglutathione lyase family enzyme
MATVQVRYIVHDVDEAIEFYCNLFGFKEIMHPAPAFAMLERGDLRLVLSKPNPQAGGGQAMLDGTKQEPGGWNRFAIEVKDLNSSVAALRIAGAHFRNDIVKGFGGNQIIVEDPSGNPIELFEPTLPEANLKSKTL